MDLKTELSKESIFSKKSQPVNTLNYLNSRSIYTVEDFINNDVEKMTPTPITRKVYRAIQRILRYKYLDEPLVQDIILDKEYDDKTLEEQFLNDMATLGIKCFSTKSAKAYLDKHGSCKMIDILREDKLDFDTFNLREFYMDYYNNQMNEKNKKKAAVEGSEKSLDILEQIDELEKLKKDLLNSLNQIDELEKLKKELLCLLNHKNDLEAKISLLTDKIKTLEGGKIYNARK